MANAPHPSDSRPNGDAPQAGPPEQADLALDAGDEAAAEVERLRAELRDRDEQLLRRAAEFQNYRRRTLEENRTVEARVQADVVTRFLDLVDDLDRTLEAADRAAEQGEAGPRFKALREGVELVHRKLHDELARLGVAPIEAVGQPFDEHLHEAMLQQDAPEGTAPNTVLGEIQKGYRQGDRVLRHARVIVAR